MDDNDMSYDNLNTKVDVLSARVDKIEKTADDLHLAVDNLVQRNAITETILSRVEAAFTRVIEVLDKNTSAINSMEKTMVKMQGEMNSNAEITVAVKKKVDQIEANFEASEEKAKIDFRDIFKELIKSRAIWLIGGGVFVAFIQMIIAIMQNIDKIITIFQ